MAKPWIVRPAVVVVLAVLVIAAAVGPLTAAGQRPRGAEEAGGDGGPPAGAPSPIGDRSPAPSGNRARLAGFAPDAVVDVYLHTDDPATLAGELATAGATTRSPVTSSPIRATVTVAEVRRLADLGIVFDAEVVIPPDETAITEGLGLSGIDAVQSAGNAGAGTKVAIVDVGFLGWEALVGQDLPPSDRLTTNAAWTGTLNGSATRTSAHGTAVAEIVHDLAPAAHLYLIPIDQASDLEGVVDYVLAEGIDVVNTSLGWTAGPFDGTGPESLPVARAIDAGVTWVTSAGNYAEEHWGGPAVDGDGDGWIEFDADGTDDINWFLVDNSSGTTTDYQYVYASFTDHTVGASLCLLEWTGTEWIEYPDADTWCTDEEIATDRPGTRQGVVATPAGTEQYFGLAIYVGDGIPGDVDVFVPKLPGTLEYVDPSFSVSCPGCVVDAVTVAAARACDPTDLEDYSSQGPTIDFVPKPDITGWAVVSTSSYGSVDAGLSCASQRGFNGTSAASPHVAAVAALYKASFPDASPDGVKAALIDMTVAGPYGRSAQDNAWGWGVLYADAATLAGSSSPQAAVPTWSNPDLAVTAAATTSIGLRWSGLSDGDAVESFRVYSSNLASGSPEGTLIGEVPGDARAATVIQLSPATEYTFRIEAVAGGLESADGPLVTVRTAASFADTPGHTFEADIAWLSSTGITQGCDADGRFCPDLPVTRAQMASFLARALGLTPQSGDRFADVSGTHEANINALAAAGITLGCSSDGTRFCPDARVTRAQMASFLVRSFGFPAAATDLFVDDSGDTHEPSINALAEAGVTLGCAPGSYCPDDHVTRGQMAAFLHRALLAVGSTTYEQGGPALVPAT